MPWFMFIWDESDDGNIRHIEEHDLTPEDVQYVIENPVDTTRSRSSKRQAAKGYTPDGRFIFVAYEFLDALTIYVRTAYEI